MTVEERKERIAEAIRKYQERKRLNERIREILSRKPRRHYR